MKPCRSYYSIETERVSVPVEFQSKTRLPGDPQGHEHLGFALFRRDLLMIAMAEREAGGAPTIRKIDVETLDTVMSGDRCVAATG
jgi:hypothetical protein